MFFHILCVIGTEDYKKSVMEIRRKCQRVSKNRLIFIDGSGMRFEPRPLTGLAPSGQTPKTSVEKAEKYEPRVDIMGAISYNGPLRVRQKLPSKGEQSQTRLKKIGVKGYTKPMVKNFLRLRLAPKIKAMKVERVILCMDKGLSFKEEEAKEQLRLGGANNLEAVWILPTNSAKYVSPLDNTLWHSLKQRVRAL